MTSRTPSRRDVLKAAGAFAGVQLLSPVIFRGGTAWAAGEVDPATKERFRVIVIDLAGGNDGLNTVVPMDGVHRAVYEKVRVATRIPVADLNPLGATNGGNVGLNKNLSTVYNLWTQNRVAVVQGVDYPNHDYSHFVSDDIWQSGVVGSAAHTGWVGRHLDRVGIGAGELRGVGIGGMLPLALYGATKMGEQVNSLGEASFVDGGATAGTAGKRHAAFAGYDAEAAGLGAAYGDTCRAAYDLAVATTGLTAAAPGGLANAMLTARSLMTANLGTETVFITTGGFDTHDNQASRHAALLKDLDRAIEAFYYGTRDGVAITTGGVADDALPGDLGTVPVAGTPIGPVDPALAARTLIVTFSEFGRRIGDNGSGTDHGAAAPMLLVGPPAATPGSGVPTLVPGLHRDHPGLGTLTLTADNLAMTTDFRSVYQSVLTGWLRAPADPAFTSLSGTGVGSQGEIAGLFGTA